MASLAIITDDPGWHGARLKQALETMGHSVQYLSLTCCEMNIGEEGLPLKLPGFPDSLPQGVFVRGVPGGSFEQVTFYLDILHALSHLGITVYNNARAIERTVDKAMTSWLLKQAQIPTPPTWVVNQTTQARAIAETELRAGYPIVSKPLFGSQGIGVQLHRTLEDLDKLADSNGIFYLQRFIDNGSENSSDWRVFVIRGRAIAAMRRWGSGWLNNVAQGARCEPEQLGKSALCDLAEAAVAVLDMAYAGVDIMQSATGEFTVIEVNSVPAWKGLQSVSSCNIAELLINDFVSGVNEHP